VTPTAPITFDRATGQLTGAGMIERAAVAALRAGSKVTLPFEHRGYSIGCRIVSAVVEEREIIVRLNDDSVFAFPLADGYWSRMLNRRYIYEAELDQFLRVVAGVDYAFIDCGANFGLWSVLVSSREFGRHSALAIEASPDNTIKLRRNAELNGNRFEVLNRAIGGKTGGMARISGKKHEALSIIPDGGPMSGAEVPIIALDSLLDDGLIKPQRVVIKLDVEGVEIEAIKGGARLLQSDSVILCEEHGNDPGHTVSRYILEQTPLKLIVYDPRSNRMETVTELSILDRIKVSSHVGYNVFGTASAFWQDRINALNANAAHRMQ
jgi:FkbM family methyltransferase